MARPKPVFTQITPQIFKLDIPWLGGRVPVGVWLVRHGETWTLIDAGPPGWEDHILAQVLEQTGGRIPEMLVLTHGHADHGAAAERMYAAWRLPVAAGRDEIPYLIGPHRYRDLAREPLYRLLQRSNMALLGRNVQLPLDTGARVAGMDVFHVPGHAPGMIALLHPQDRALIAADTFRSVNGGLRDPFRWFTYDPAINAQSQARLGALDFDHLLVSHGAPIMNTGRQAVQEYVERGARRSRR
jgi:glyoxylase-like metal-dependent hydrolase (beta-lactamase superfamily II)